MAYEYSGILLKARVQHDVKTLQNFALFIGMNPRTFRDKVQGKRWFTWGEINNICNRLGASPAEADAYFFLHKENEKKAHLALYKKILEKDISVRSIANKLGTDRDNIFNKISGKDDFNWNEALIIQKTFFPEITLQELFKTGVA